MNVNNTNQDVNAAVATLIIIGVGCAVGDLPGGAVATAAISFGSYLDKTWGEEKPHLGLELAGALSGAVIAGTPGAAVGSIITFIGVNACNAYYDSYSSDSVEL